MPTPPPPYSAQWTATAGDWSTAGDWLEYDPTTNQPEHYVPGSDNSVTISNNGSSGYTVTYDLVDAIWSINSGTVVTIDMTGGSLTVDYGGFISGALDLASGATLTEAAGSTLIISSGVYSGTLAGGGDIKFEYGAEAIDTTNITVATWELGVGLDGAVSVTTLDDSLSYADDFLLDDVSGNNAKLDLNGYTLTLTGTATLNGTVNGHGTLDIERTATLEGHFTIDDSANVVVTSGATATEVGDVVLGYGGASGTLTIDAGANYNITTTSFLGNTAPADATISDSGTMTISDDSVATVGADFTLSGALAIDSGSTAYFDGGTLTATGAISGLGTLQFGNGEAAALDTTNLSVDEILITGGLQGGTTTLDKSISYQGAFDFESAFGDLDLNGKTLTLTGSANNLLEGNILGGGKIVVTGAANFSAEVGYQGAAADIVDNGSIDQTGYVTLNGKLTIGAGHTYTIANATSLVSDTATIVVNGTFDDASASGTSNVSGTLTATGIVLVAANDILNISGTDTFKGALSGLGVLELSGGGQASIDTTKVTVAELYLAQDGGATTFDDSFTYTGEFDFDSEFGTIDIAAGKTLTLSGATNYLYGGNIDGGGTIAVTGAADLASNIGYGTTAADIIDKGSIDQTGYVTLNGELTVDAGDSYTITNATSLVGDTATIVIDGSFDDAASGGTSYVSGTMTVTGTLSVAAGDTLDISGAETFKGALSGAGVLELSGGGQASVDTTNVTVAELLLAQDGGTTTFDVSLTYTKVFDFDSEFGTVVIDAGKTLTLTGSGDSLIGGNITGGGKIAFDGTGDIATGIGVGGAATTLIDNGTLDQTGYMDLNGLLQISSGHSYTIVDASNFASDGASLLNHGSFVDNSSSGSSYIYGQFTNAANITAETGSLIMTSEVLGTGTEKIDAAGYLQLDGASTTTQTITFSGKGGELALGDESGFQSPIHSFAAKDSIDLIGFDSSATKSFQTTSNGIIVTIADGANGTAALNFIGSYNQGGFSLSPGSNGQVLTYS